MTTTQLNNVKKTVKELSNEYNVQFDTVTDICVNELNKDVVLCRFFKTESLWNMTEVKIPMKKPYTAEYVLERIAKLEKREYVNHTETFKILVEKLKLNVSATSYGLGMESMFHGHEQMHKAGDKIGDILKANGIEFTISVSEASWVYRFNISKKESNINKIKAL